MKDHILLGEAELLGALADVEPCEDCAGGRGVHIDLETGEAVAAQVHSVPCAATTAGRPA